MNYNQLPVFKASYDLLLAIFKSSPYIKREYKYTLGEELKKEMMALMICVYRANVMKNNIVYLIEAREHLEVVKLQIRLLYDLKQISLKNMAKFSLQYDSISKQLYAWQKTVNNKLTI